MMYRDGGSGDWVAMVLMMAVVWGAIITGVVFLVRSGRSQPPSPHPHDDGERILAERFARGEIDRAEFEQRRSVLRDKS